MRTNVTLYDPPDMVRNGHSEAFRLEPNLP
jgi:hypothetical protein